MTDPKPCSPFCKACALPMPDPAPMTVAQARELNKRYEEHRQAYRLANKLPIHRRAR